MMTMCMEQRQRQEQLQRLTQEQSQLIKQYCLQVRLQMIDDLYGYRYNPEGVCPECDRRLTLLEILDGFREDPNDFSTLCTGCGHRFNPKMAFKDAFSSGELPFYCSVQTLDMLPGKECFGPDEFKRSHPAIFHSAKFHFGTLGQAFAQKGIHYGYDESVDWKEKVQPFLGRLPDTVIAKYASVSGQAVRRLRRKWCIVAFCKGSVLAEIEV